MTSRPVGSRQSPHRSLSSTLQKPPPSPPPPPSHLRRTSSQKHLSQSSLTARKNPAAVFDLTKDPVAVIDLTIDEGLTAAAEADVEGQGNTPRNAGGARLRPDLSRDSPTIIIDGTDTESQDGRTASHSRSLSIDLGDAGRQGNTPRNGGSRLKQEVSKDSDSPILVGSPSSFGERTPTWGIDGHPRRPLQLGSSGDRTSGDRTPTWGVDTPQGRPQLPSSPEGRTLTGEVDPPRRRPQLPFDAMRVSTHSPRAADEGEPSPIPMKPMPLPERSGQHEPPAVDRRRAAPASAAKKDGRPKPYTMEVPAEAPHITPNVIADFYPWMGNHPEDQFTESVIRHGFFDKAQMSHNELGSAKGVILPALKNKSGLQALSTVFTGMLAQRRARGQITSASTFKPPPRVTVTDTKREMWLKDLANPEISLRRLSRSIPHGIRGKVLLDQSLSKRIPIERAVWLAKCVGANELRSFRRKGATGAFALGGETKWIRDFTVCVEQFIEGTVSTCGESGFNSRINYAIRLAAHFHAEHLLDFEHHMEWLVSSLENASPSKLPVWLLISKVYWKRDLLRYRKYGRRVAAALMDHLATIQTFPDPDIFAPLSDQLRDRIKVLMESDPNSFLLPRVLAKHRDMMHKSLDGDPRCRAIFDWIDRRNARFDDPNPKKEPSPRQRLIQLLDTTLEKPPSADLPQLCWQVSPDKRMVLQTVLEWSSSSHRPGNTKVYVAAAILRFCSTCRVDVSEEVLYFLDSEVCVWGRDTPAFYHLVCELSRSGHFSTASYLKWLMARGGIDEAVDIAREGRCATRLLVELPAHSLSRGMVSLRGTLLGRVGYSVDEEEDETSVCMASIDRLLAASQGSMDADQDMVGVDPERTFEDLAELGRAPKSKIGSWLRQKLRLQVREETRPAPDWAHSDSKWAGSLITSSEFSIVRACLEAIDDYPMLADVLKSVMGSSDPEVLASCADTLNLNLCTFAAIGVLDGLFDVLTTRLRTLSDDLDSVPRVFLVALSDLAARMPGQSLVARQLAQELARGDRKTAADVCSPVSDHMAFVQTAEVDFTDEIEKVLASGNSMDQATLMRLFQRISTRLEELWTKSPEHQRSCVLLLTRLRTFDARKFDLLMAEWVHRFMQMPDRPSVLSVLGPLISAGCLTLSDAVANGADIFMTLDPGNPAKVDIARDLFSLVVAPSNQLEVLTPEEAYRLRIKQCHLRQDHPVRTLNVICRALRYSGPKNGSTLFPALDSVDPIAMYGLMQRLILAGAGSVSENVVLPLLRLGDEKVEGSVIAIVDKLLAAERYRDGPRSISIDEVLSLAGDLTVPFCQVKLASMFGVEDTGMSNAEDDGSERFAALDVAMQIAVCSNDLNWTCVVPLFKSSMAEHVRQRSESQFLATFPTPTSLIPEEEMFNRMLRAENLLDIVRVTSRVTSSTPSASKLGPEIVSTLVNLWHILYHTECPSTREQVVTIWMPLVHSFVTLLRAPFEATKSGQECRAKAVLALGALTLQLEAQSTRTIGMNRLIEETYDLALHLVDDLSEEMRQQCVRHVREAVSNHRISYLFSAAANPSEWLMLQQKERAPPVPPGMSGPEARAMAVPDKEKITPFMLRRWEMLGESTPNVGENDTSLSLTLFGARRG